MLYYGYVIAGRPLRLKAEIGVYATSASESPTTLSGYGTFVTASECGTRNTTH